MAPRHSQELSAETRKGGLKNLRPPFPVFGGLGKLDFVLRFSDQIQSLVPDFSKTPVERVLPPQERKHRRTPLGQLVHGDVEPDVPARVL